MRALWTTGGARRPTPDIPGRRRMTESGRAGRRASRGIGRWAAGGPTARRLGAGPVDREPTGPARAVRARGHARDGCVAPWHCLDALAIRAPGAVLARA